MPKNVTWPSPTKQTGNIYNIVYKSTSYVLVIDWPGKSSSVMGKSFSVMAGFGQNLNKFKYFIVNKMHNLNTNPSCQSHIKLWVLVHEGQCVHKDLNKCHWGTLYHWARAWLLSLIQGKPVKLIFAYSFSLERQVSFVHPGQEAVTTPNLCVFGLTWAYAYVY